MQIPLFVSRVFPDPWIHPNHLARPPILSSARFRVCSLPGRSATLSVSTHLRITWAENTETPYTLLLSGC